MVRKWTVRFGYSKRKKRMHKTKLDKDKWSEVYTAVGEIIDR